MKRRHPEDRTRAALAYNKALATNYGVPATVNGSVTPTTRDAPLGAGRFCLVPFRTAGANRIIEAALRSSLRSRNLEHPTFSSDRQRSRVSEALTLFSPHRQLAGLTILAAASFGCDPFYSVFLPSDCRAVGSDVVGTRADMTTSSTVTDRLQISLADSCSFAFSRMPSEPGGVVLVVGLCGEMSLKSRRHQLKVPDFRLVPRQEPGARVLAPNGASVLEAWKNQSTPRARLMTHRPSHPSTSTG